MQASDVLGTTQQLCRTVAGLVPGAEWVTAMVLAAGDTEAAWSWQFGSRHSSPEQPAAEDQVKWVDEVN